MKKKIKRRGSFASYRDHKDKTLWRCDVEEMAKHLSQNWGNIPRSLGNTKAMEIHLLALAYLDLKKELAKKDGDVK